MNHKIKYLIGGTILNIVYFWFLWNALFENQTGMLTAIKIGVYIGLVGNLLVTLTVKTFSYKASKALIKDQSPKWYNFITYTLQTIMFIKAGMLFYGLLTIANFTMFLIWMYIGEKNIKSKFSLFDELNLSDVSVKTEIKEEAKNRPEFFRDLNS